MKEQRPPGDRLSRVFGQLGALTRNHLRIETAVELPSGELLVGGWHPEAGALHVSAGGATVTAFRYPRRDVNEALGAAPGTALAFIALVTKGESSEDLTYQVEGMRRRDMYLRTRPADQTKVREQLSWIFDRQTTTFASVRDHYRPMIQALEHGQHVAPTRLTSSEFALRYFDDQWYLGFYGDVADAGVDPLRHWLGPGRGEGRNPHPLVNAPWYGQRYGIAAAGALGDYLARGWIKGTNPSPLVDTAYVLRTFGNIGTPLAWLARELQLGHDVDTGFLDTAELVTITGEVTPEPVPPARVVADYVRSGWAVPWMRTWRGIRQADYVDDADWMLPGDHARPSARRAPISVVVPVYGIGAPMDRCLISVSEDLGAHDQAIIVLDHPERIDWPVLDRLAVDPRWTVVFTGGGAGFSGAVNAGVEAAEPGNDLLILNSDAVVFPGTSDAMARHAEGHPRAASITALSNQGSLASYPRPARGAPFVPGGTPGRIALAVREANPGAVAAVPTSMGHCFWVRRSAWADAGALDAARFPSGYGEENEWSLRASERGWQHYVALDTFVWHQGSASFGRSRADELTRQGLKELERTNPGLSRTFMRAGEDYRLETAPAYARIDARRVARAFGDAGVRRVVITHDMGGGIDEFVSREGRYDPTADVLILLSTSEPTFRVVMDSMPLPSLDGSGDGPAIAMLREIIDLMGAQEVEVHSVVSKEPIEAMEQLVDLATPMTLIQHDYFLACPRVTMFGGAPGGQGPVYCGGEQEISACQACIGHWGSQYFTGDMTLWRAAGTKLHSSARTVWVPSVEADAVLSPYGLPGRPWEHCKPRPASGRRATPAVNVLVVGSISEAKGARVLREVAALNRLVDGPLVIGLMGAYDEQFGRYLQVFDVLYGQYDNTELEVLPEQPAVVFLPSVWPETHLYTVDDARILAPDATCVVFDVGGAQTRRAHENFSSVVELNGTDPSYVYDQLVRAITGGADAGGDRS